MYHLCLATLICFHILLSIRVSNSNTDEMNEEAPVLITTACKLGFQFPCRSSSIASCWNYFVKEDFSSLKASFHLRNR